MGVKWGFQWGKVVSGGTLFLIGGIVSLVLWFAGYVNLWAIGAMVIGLFTMLTGLMGEEGVW